MAQLMKGYVYLLTDGEFFKIGVTRGSIEKRIKKLQTGNPDNITIVNYHLTEYPFKLESALHARHAHQRINNEWFDLNVNDVTNFKQECEKIDQMFDQLKGNPFF